MGEELLFGDKVEVIRGFYKGCCGILLEELNSGKIYSIRLRTICKDNTLKTPVIQEFVENLRRIS